jgi:hypothetical protein
MTSVFQGVTEVDSLILEEYHIYRWVSSVPFSVRKSQKWQRLGQTQFKSGTH